ncbi:carbohydrate esterase family 16 protein [Phanerochaete carnosa HHB-10118-sp]|uniref:Carbohydrate esterase family 16 protein n=1 Tax=Phanerochaete carnosa (strain HHB-10118-sp) TaxID=650164 RepID=K5W5T3_PHACS|nr:carbohydrate esterase family 16 protein [Phanerochaete carnosa HHB-10118-sp]EKM54515.1 carbohydrate esterase family 16 protein [Phanerochaete carnosa HHB-10118-sp]
MITFSFTLLVAAVGLVSAAQRGPLPGQIKNLVTFGDDDALRMQVSTGDNATAWPIFAAQDGGFKLFPFARSGATCSNNITLRPFPSVFESQLPLYFTEVNNGSLRLNSEETIYTLWIGTNDVGANSLIVGQGTPGATVVNTTTCAVNWVKTLYESGARNFLFQNMIPLQKTILYSADSYPNRYWTLERNTTEWSVFMTELTNAGNAISRALLELLAPTLPGAHVGYFDSYQFFEDMLSNPGKFLNGTVPPNTTGAINHCVFALNASTSDPGNCTVATGSARDSFFWYDELHPSEQTDRNVGKAIAAAAKRTSEQYTTWFS